MNKKFTTLFIAVIALLTAINIVSASWWSDLFTPKIKTETSLGATFCFPYQGCTGTSTAPTAGQLLRGKSTGVYELLATSTDYSVFNIDANGYPAWTQTLGTQSNPLTSVSATNLYASTTQTETLYISGSIDPGPLIVATTTITAPDIYWKYDVDTGLGWLADNKQALYTAGTAQLTVDASGNVGIGTTGPGSTLHLWEGVGEQSEIRMNSGNGSGRTWTINAPSAGTSLRFGRSGVADDMTIDNLGNVGIGTTNPGYKLEVSGDSYILGNSTTTKSFYVGTSNLVVQETGNVGIGTAGPTAALTVMNVLTTSGRAAEFYRDVASGNHADIFVGKTNAVAQSGIFRHYYSTTAADTYVAIMNTGDTDSLVIKKGGNVGIGTTSPGEKLHLYGSGAQKLKIESSTTSGVVGIHLRDNGGGYDTQIYQNADHNLQIDTESATGAMVITSTGNVGIGTTGPSGKLHVVQTTANTGGAQFEVNFTGTSPSNVGGMTLINTGGVNTYSGMVFSDGAGQTGYASVGAQVTDATNNQGELSFSTRNSSNSFGERMRISKDGNVGIGTTTPTSLLQVSGATPKFYLSNTSGATDGKHWFLSNSSGDFSLGTTSDSLATNSTFLTVKGSTGNVGIGTTSPTTLIQAGSTATTTISALSSSGNKGGRLILMDTNGSTCTEITTNAGAITGKAVTCP